MGFFKNGYKKESDIAEYLKRVPDHFIAGYGGNTMCAQVSSAEQTLIIDAGSGIKALGQELMAGRCGKGQGIVHLFFTHFHWDHILGLPFFIPIFIPGNQIHVYAVQKDLEDMFKIVFKKPYFPVPFKALASSIKFHRLKPRKKLSVGPLEVTPYRLDHPDPCWGYRVESGGKAYAHCVDTESTRLRKEDLGEDLPLYQNADLMLYDAQYTLLESFEKIDWGHSSSSKGIDIALNYGIKHAVFVHHDPFASNIKIAEAEKSTQAYVDAQFKVFKKIGKKNFSGFKWHFAREGMEVDLG